MAGGALLGGALYREAYGLPFVVVIGLGIVMLLVLAFAGRGRPAPPAGVQTPRDDGAACAPPSSPSATPSSPSATLGTTKETT
jgi:hypothetical protein